MIVVICKACNASFAVQSLKGIFVKINDPEEPGTLQVPTCVGCRVKLSAQVEELRTNFFYKK